MRYKNIVLSGGGFKGFVYLGVLKAFEKLNLSFDCYCGTSIGSVFCLMMVLKFNSEEIFNIIKKFKFENLFTLNPDIDSFLNKYGLSDGKYIENFIKLLLEKRVGNPNITFLELYNKTKKHLMINTLCLNDSEIVFLDHKNNPNLKIWKAIRMSISIPFIYTPVMYNDKYYVDSGIFDNFPLYNFDQKESLGILIETKSTKFDIKSFKSYTSAVLNFLLTKPCFYKNVIKIDTNIHSLQNLTLNEKYELIKLGYNSTINNLIHKKRC